MGSSKSIKRTDPPIKPRKKTSEAKLDSLEKAGYITFRQMAKGVSKKMTPPEIGGQYFKPPFKSVSKTIKK